MAAPPRRSLTLPEELEKIEQQITLTLQEIDHNFNKAHRIVTSSIIPVVERYGQQSQAVWENAKFWKQFFEAAANVCISGYEEPTTTYTEGETTRAGDQTTQHGETTATRGPGGNETYYSTTEEGGISYLDETSISVDAAKRQRRRTETQQAHVGGEEEEEEEEDLIGDNDDVLGDVTDDSLLASLHLDQSTPKPRKQKWANIDSPYEKMKKTLDSTEAAAGPTRTTRAKPQPQQQKTYRSDDDAFSLSSSPEPEPPSLRTNLGPSNPPPSTPRRGGSVGAGRPRFGQPSTRKNPNFSPFLAHGTSPAKPAARNDPNQDPLLHRILDRNWRIQATPRGKSQPSRYRNLPLPSVTPRHPGIFTPKTRKFQADSDDDDDLLASPNMDSPAPPDLQTQIFDSPIVARRKPSSQPPLPTIPASTSTMSRSSARRAAANPDPKTPSRIRNPTGISRSRLPEAPIPHPLSSKKLRALGDYDIPASTRRAARPAPGTHWPVLGESSKAGRIEDNPLDDDDDDELLLSPPPMSPPVTIQFSLPQRQILATPAREASRRLVRDILRTAGADESNTTGNESKEEGEGEEEEDWEVDLGDYGGGGGGGGGGGRGISSWRTTGRGMDLEASPTIVRGKGMEEIADETF